MKLRYLPNDDEVRLTKSLLSSTKNKIDNMNIVISREEELALHRISVRIMENMEFYIQKYINGSYSTEIRDIIKSLEAELIKKDDEMGWKASLYFLLKGIYNYAVKYKTNIFEN